VERPFQVGDWVLIGDIEGTVEELGFRSTRIRTFYNSLITLPNVNLISAAVDNYGARRYRRWKTTLGVTYDTPPEKIEAFCEGIRELIRRHPYTRKDFFLVFLNDFGASSVDILVYMFFETPDWDTELRERHRLAVDILRLAGRLEVEFAFPTQTLHLVRGVKAGETPAVPDYDSQVERALGSGRRIARDLVETALRGEVPPPAEATGMRERGESAES
jgi:MscS family membrane protein